MSPEEEFVQLYGNRVAGEALGVSRKVGSEEWGHSVPSTCDWRKAGTFSPIRNQVSASTPSPAAWPNPALGGGGGEEGCTWGDGGLQSFPTPTATILSPLATLQLLLGHRGSGQHRGPMGHQVQSVCGGLRAAYGWGLGLGAEGGGGA